MEVPVEIGPITMLTLADQISQVAGKGKGCVFKEEQPLFESDAFFMIYFFSNGSEPGTHVTAGKRIFCMYVFHGKIRLIKFCAFTLFENRGKSNDSLHLISSNVTGSFFNLRISSRSSVRSLNA